MDERRNSVEAFTLEGSSNFGVLLLHGFTANAGQMAELGELLHAQGYTVRAPLLPGHGGKVEQMKGVSWRDWVACARQEYTLLREKCDRVAVAGLSMGGGLATMLAEEYPVDAYIAYAPCVRMKEAIAWAARIARVANLYAKNDRGEKTFPLELGYDVWRVASRAMLHAFAITAPALIFQGAKDETIDPRGAKRLYDSLSSAKKDFVWLEESPHVCITGPEKQTIFTRTVEFLNAVRDGD